MKRYICLLVMLFIFTGAKPAAAQQRYIVRSTGGLSSVLNLCKVLGCQVRGQLDGQIGQSFLVTSTTNLVGNLVGGLVNFLEALLGITSVELDQLMTIGPHSLLPSSPSNQLWQRTPINYYGTTVWYGYAYQPAAHIVRLPDVQNGFHVTGSGVVADINTGVDPTHPALQGVLMQGYDFTRNQPGASEMLDFMSPYPAACSGCAPAKVNQSSAAILDQSSAAILDDSHYAAFGHGTMVAGVIHLVAPTARILPVKAFHPDGTGYLSDVIRATYYAVENHANVINMSFNFTSPSPELTRAMAYANSHSAICVASAGNAGRQEYAYPASLRNVMGVASTSDFDARSSFSNYGPQVVWVAAPGEQIVSTYPFGTYASSSGTSFSAPMVSGGVALLLGANPNLTSSAAAAAIAQAQVLTPDLVNGRLDLYRAMWSVSRPNPTPAPSSDDQE
ncbi:MAG TPA: S8 family serine peptidase [Candidatus Dormibacteraeota bacterium]|nr:S8 family serine peptidase [Candidatus Dormibacteraeota bacterium]